MWKRLQGHGREREKPAQIGNPVLLETTYDEDQLRRNPNVTDLQNANHQFNAPARSQLQYTLSTLPPPDYPDYRESEVPTVYSEYSSSPYDLTHYYDNPVATSPSAYEDISPPSSPEPEHLVSSSGQPRRFRSMRDVSPVDENRMKLEGSSRGGSNIPVLRPGDSQSGLKQKFWGGKVVPSSKAKWDEYSGEPTLSQADKAASVGLGSYGQGAGPSDPQPMGYRVSVTGPEKRVVSLSERVGRFGTRPPVEIARPREPWSRATGRSEIAPPLRDEPSTNPLQLPRKPMSSAMERPNRDASNVLVPDTAPVTGETGDFDMHNDPIKPIVPLKVGRNSPPRSGFTSPTSPTNPGLGIRTFSNPSPATPTQHSQGPVKATREQTEPRVPLTQRTATPPYNAIEKDMQAPTSRFSWTTYNSATTYQHSPPPSPPDPLFFSATPVPRQRVVTEPISAASSILSRRRPVPQADRFPGLAQNRKPVSAETLSPGTPRTQAMHSPFGPSDPPSPSAASTFSTATTGTVKALPRPPTTLSASDHISLLESQIEDLRVRSRNVYRLLDDLNRAAPPNPLITDFKRARLVEQRKRAFEDELSEIRREEHDVGLKLHRAWKRREREDPNNTGSALWVRRVTS